MRSTARHSVPSVSRQAFAVLVASAMLCLPGSPALAQCGGLVGALNCITEKIEAANEPAADSRQPDDEALERLRSLDAEPQASAARTQGGLAVNEDGEYPIVETTTDPETGITRETQRFADGSQAITELDAEGRVLSTEYLDAEGEPVLAGAFDPDEGIVAGAAIDEETGEVVAGAVRVGEDADGNPTIEGIGENGERIEGGVLADGTAVVTETFPDGRVVDTVVAPDGTVAVIETHPDGTVRESAFAPDGSSFELTRNEKGELVGARGNHADGTEWRSDDEGNLVEVATTEEGTVETTTDRHGNKTIVTRDENGEVIARSEERVTPKEPGQEYYERVHEASNWADLSDERKARYAKSELAVRQAAAADPENAEAAAAAQTEREKRLERVKREQEVLAAYEKGDRLRREYKEAKARGDDAAVERILREQDEHHEASMGIFEFTGEEVAAMERKQAIRDRIAAEIVPNAIGMADTQHGRAFGRVDEVIDREVRDAASQDQDWQQGLKEDVTAATRYVSIGSEMQQWTAKSTRRADHLLTFAEHKEERLNRMLADPETTAEEREVIREMLDMASLQKEGALRQLADNAELTATGYAVDVAMLATGGAANLIAAGSKAVAGAVARKAAAGAIAGKAAAGAVARRALASNAARAIAKRAAPVVAKAQPVAQTVAGVAKGGVATARGLAQASQGALQRAATAGGNATRKAISESTRNRLAQLAIGTRNLASKAATEASKHKMLTGMAKDAALAGSVDATMQVIRTGTIDPGELVRSMAMNATVGRAVASAVPKLPVPTPRPGVAHPTPTPAPHGAATPAPQPVLHGSSPNAAAASHSAAAAARAPAPHAQPAATAAAPAPAPAPAKPAATPPKPSPAPKPATTASAAQPQPAAPAKPTQTASAAPAAKPKPPRPPQPAAAPVKPTQTASATPAAKPKPRPVETASAPQAAKPAPRPNPGAATPAQPKVASAPPAPKPAQTAAASAPAPAKPASPKPTRPKQKPAQPKPVARASTSPAGSGASAPVASAAAPAPKASGDSTARFVPAAASASAAHGASKPPPVANAPGSPASGPAQTASAPAPPAKTAPPAAMADGPSAASAASESGPAGSTTASNPTPEVPVVPEAPPPDGSVPPPTPPPEVDLATMTEQQLWDLAQQRIDHLESLLRDRTAQHVTVNATVVQVEGMPGTRQIVYTASTNKGRPPRVDSEQGGGPLSDYLNGNESWSDAGVQLGTANERLTAILTDEGWVVLQDLEDGVVHGTPVLDQHGNEIHVALDNPNGQPAIDTWEALRESKKTGEMKWMKDVEGHLIDLDTNQPYEKYNSKNQSETACNDHHAEMRGQAHADAHGLEVVIQVPSKQCCAMCAPVVGDAAPPHLRRDDG